jgi:tetratricopeptide (TPR) repeat protein
MKKFSLVILTTLLIFSCSKSPEKLKEDSDRFFNQAIDYYERGYYNQASDLFKKVIDIETKLGNKQRIANSYLFLGLINYQNSDFNQSLKNYQNSLEIFQSLNDKKNELLVKNNIAGIYSLLGEYQKAAEIYSDVIGKSLIFADKESEAIASSNLGELFQEQWDFEKSFEYFKKAYDAYEIIGDVKGMIYCLNKIGELFISSKNYSEASKTFDMAVELGRKNNSNYLIQEIYNNIGLIYFQNNQISRAKDFFELALNSVSPSETNQQILISLRNNLGDCEFKNQSYSKAIENYSLALEMSEKSFVKFLSPILQFKIGICAEQLFFLNGDEKQKKQAERFLQFAINRFDENKDWKNLKYGLTALASFYSSSGEQKKSLKYFSRLLDLPLTIDLKPDDNLKSFALIPDYDFSFLSKTVNDIGGEKAFYFIEKLKLQNLLEYFLRFREFNFLSEELKEKFDNLKKDILLQNTYQRIITQELALPIRQRNGEKVDIANERCKDVTEKLEETFESLSKNFSFLKYIKDNKFILDKNLDDDKIYIEIFPSGQDLICFFISKDGITYKIIKTDFESFKFNLQILVNNLETFLMDELKIFSSSNFSQVADEILAEVQKKNFNSKELVFLLNGKELDFLPHLFFSKKFNSFIFERYDISYRYFISSDDFQGNVKILAVLKNGKVKSIDELMSEKSLTRYQSPSLQNQTNLKKPVRIGLREEIKKENLSESITKVKSVDGLILDDDLVLNQTSPDLIYLRNETVDNQSRFYFRDLLNYQPKFLIIKSFKGEGTNLLTSFLAILEFTNTRLVLFPLIKSHQAISENFLYNYKKRVENKSLNIASNEFFELMDENFKEKRNSKFLWIKFIN